MEPLPRLKWYALRDVDPDIEVLVITPRRWKEQDFWQVSATTTTGDRVRFQPLDTLLEGYVSRHFYWSPRFLTTIREFQPDIIQVEAEPWSVLYAQTTALRGIVARRAKLVFFTWWNRPRRIPFPFSVIHRACLRVTDFVIAGNHGALDVLRGHGYSGPTAVVPQLGVDVERYSPGSARTALLDRLGLADTFVVGYVGRLTKSKGVDTLLHAFAAVKDARRCLLIVGDGPERKELERRAIELGVESSVRFTGTVHREAIPEYLNCMNLLVLPSTREQWEQFGHVLIEAMACGVPVVGSTSGEIPAIIGDVGLVFPMGDEAKLASCIARVAADPGFRARCRDRGLDRVRNDYSHEAIGHALSGVYRGIVGH
jgi:glycosyltransferase involved in cell wall biosynthesis